MVSGHTTDIRIREVEIGFERHAYRTPMKFGGNVVTDAVLLDVTMTVESRTGRVATGRGSMPLAGAWAFPPKAVPLEESLCAMQALAHRLADVTRHCTQTAHPLDLMVALEPLYLREAAKLSQERNLAEPIPKLCALMVASPFDAAAFDGFGKAAGIHAYQGLSKEFLPHDLSHYLNDDFRGQHLDRYVAQQPKESLPLCHLVGALDPLTAAENTNPIGDGLPETLEEWIEAEGLTHLKIKLDGNDLTWDVQRIVAVDKVTSQVQARRGVDQWFYSLDFNERARNVQYVVECLYQVLRRSEAAFQRIAYIEQPTARDLKSQPKNPVYAAAAMKPIVIDESLVDLESLRLARELGYNGVALKVCKGQTQSLLMAAAAQHYGMFLCAQDLTCPGRSFLHSAGLAAWLPPVTAIEGNARQYVPSANAGWHERFPEIFTVQNGTIRTGRLIAPGLGIEE